MNFLLHRHLAARDLGSAAAGAGAMLPDLWRMADRRVRPSPTAERPAAVSAALAEVLAGIEHHVAADRWFHAAPVFARGEHRLAEALRRTPARAPRLGLFAHVLWEMCLDGALVRRVGFEALLADLRAGLDAIDGAPSETAASIHYFCRATQDAAAQRAAFEARLTRLRDELARGPWIAGYQDGLGLAVRLAGVRARLGFAPFTPAELESLAALLDSLAEAADRDLDELLRISASS